MQITLNSEARDLAGPMTVKELLVELGLDEGRVAVEINRRILKKDEFDEVSVSDGDNLEVVHFVGGG
jgi:thiamine biosynthesis protein ThiS